jgi:hypothetical protein
MSVFSSVIKGLNEALDYRQGKIAARSTKLSIKPVSEFDNIEIKK